MKKLTKLFIVLTVLLTVTTGAASADWHACTPLQVLTFDLGDSVSTRIRVNDSCSAVRDWDSKWISAPGAIADSAREIALSSIARNKQISIHLDGGLEQNYILTADAVGTYR